MKSLNDLIRRYGLQNLHELLSNSLILTPMAVVLCLLVASCAEEKFTDAASNTWNIHVAEASIVENPAGSPGGSGTFVEVPLTLRYVGPPDVTVPKPHVTFQPRDSSVVDMAHFAASFATDPAAMDRGLTLSNLFQASGDPVTLKTGDHFEVRLAFTWTASSTPSNGLLMFADVPPVEVTIR